MSDSYSDLIGDELYEMPAFYTGAPMPSWLTWSPWPLMVSRRRLEGRTALPRAVCSWALDSGGFSELDMFGGWRLDTRTYVEFVARCDREIGRLDFAGPQDWMCEPRMLTKTGLTVAEHQARTVANYVECAELWPQFSDDSCAIIPAVQGDTPDSYLKCVDLYDRAGVDLYRLDWVGLGSVCRRESTDEILAIVRSLWPLPLHGFGVKTAGLRRYGPLLKSADSMAWSLRGMHLPGCAPDHKHENNCPRHCAAWRRKVLAALGDDGDYYGSDPGPEAARRLLAA